LIRIDHKCEARLVLLPGLDGTGELFAPFIDELGEIRSQVIAYPADRAMNYAEHESCARSQLPMDEDFVLLGESFSGPVSIAIAAAPPANETRSCQRDGPRDP
jgi:pimeloyl-[acyl-carrier protein] methyl ester esterase